jgi:hypothetical protein
VYVADYCKHPAAHILRKNACRPEFETAPPLDSAAVDGKGQPRKRQLWMAHLAVIVQMPTIRCTDVR